MLEVLRKSQNIIKASLCCLKNLKHESNPATNSQLKVINYRNPSQTSKKSIKVAKLEEEKKLNCLQASRMTTYMTTKLITKNLCRQPIMDMRLEEKVQVAIQDGVLLSKRRRKRQMPAHKSLMA